MLITGRGDGRAQKVGMGIDRMNDGGKHGEELYVLLRRFAGIEQVVALIVGQRPVDMLARAIDTGKRFLMQQTDQSVPACHFFHEIHKNLVVVGGKVGPFKNRCKFILVRRHFVMTGGHRNTKFIRLFRNLEHEIQHPLLDGSEILVFELLTFW